MKWVRDRWIIAVKTKSIILLPLANARRNTLRRQDQSNAAAAPVSIAGLADCDVMFFKVEKAGGH